MFEHSHYGRIVVAEFDNVLIIALTKQVIKNVTCTVELNKFINKLR